MTVLGEYYAALGDLIHRFEGTLEQFAGDGLMVFFNDPLPCDDAALRAIRMAVAMRSRVQDLSASGSVAATTSASRSASPRASPRWAGSVSKAATTTPPSAASRTWPSRLCAEAAQDQILVTQRVHGAAQDYVVERSLGDMTLRGFSRPVGVFDIKGLDAARVTQMTDRHASDGVALSDLDDAQRYAAVRPAPAADAAGVGRMRLNEEGESVVVIPSVTVDRVNERAGVDGAGHGGAVPVPAPAPPGAAPADGLRDLHADRARRRRVLPGAAARRHPQPRAGSALPRRGPRLLAPALSEKLLERPRLLRRIAELVPDRARSHLVPYNTTPLERDLGCRPGHPDVRG